MICEVCDKELKDDYPYDVCSECCEILRDALKEPVVAMLDETGLHAIN